MKNKVNSDKTLEQLENIGIQRRMLRFIRELISERWIKVRVERFISPTDRLGNSTEKGAQCNTLPSGNQWYIRRIGK